MHFLHPTVSETLSRLHAPNMVGTLQLLQHLHSPERPGKDQNTSFPQWRHERWDDPTSSQVTCAVPQGHARWVDRAKSAHHRSEGAHLNRHGLWSDVPQAHACNTLHDSQHAARCCLQSRISICSLFLQQCLDAARAIGSEPKQDGETRMHAIPVE